MSLKSIPGLVTHSTSGWGPSTTRVTAKVLQTDIPYAPFGKSDKIGRIADPDSVLYKAGRWYGNDGTNEAFVSNARRENAEFQVVDKRSVKARFNKRKNFHNRWRRQYYNSKTYAGKQRAEAKVEMMKKTAKQRPQRRKKRINYRNSYNWKKYSNKTKKPQSVAVGETWEEVETMTFDALNDVEPFEAPPAVRDVYKCGAIRAYDSTLARINGKNLRKLESYPDTTFLSVSTTEDPIVASLAQEGAGRIFVTDDILAALMVSTRSVDPWDLVVKRIGDYLFIDKRDDGTFDFPRVRETATEPPNDDNGKTFINAPEPLSREAALVNQAYSQQVITDAKEPIRYENTSPFVDEDANVPEVGYKYRHFSVEDEEAEHAHMDVVVRTQIDAYQLRGAQKKTVAVHAFHQYAVSNNDLNWRNVLDTQGGGVLASVVKDEASRLARFTTRALLADADLVSLGFVTRSHPSRHLDHIILGTQVHRTKTIASQMGLAQEALWAVASRIFDSLLSLDEGEYVLLKDANESVLRVYAIPEGSLDDAGPSDA